MCQYASHSQGHPWRFALSRHTEVTVGLFFTQSWWFVTTTLSCSFFCLRQYLKKTPKKTLCLDERNHAQTAAALKIIFHRVNREYEFLGQSDLHFYPESWQSALPSMVLWQVVHTAMSLSKEARMPFYALWTQQTRTMLSNSLLNSSLHLCVPSFSSYTFKEGFTWKLRRHLTFIGIKVLTF